MVLVMIVMVVVVMMMVVTADVIADSPNAYLKIHQFSFAISLIIIDADADNSCPLNSKLDCKKTTARS
jgi:cadmium resistance protein CadD (predicted permease)